MEIDEIYYLFNIKSHSLLSGRDTEDDGLEDEILDCIYH